MTRREIADTLAKVINKYNKFKDVVDSWGSVEAFADSLYESIEKNDLWDLMDILVWIEDRGQYVDRCFVHDHFKITVR